MVDAPIDAFLWRRAEKVGEPTDTEEVARIEWKPIQEIVRLARRGQLLGSGTIIPVLLYALSHGSPGLGGGGDRRHARGADGEDGGEGGGGDAGGGDDEVGRDG